MSRWGLFYKALEILEPEEWNRLIDALNELDSRCPVKFAGGMEVFSGDGSTVMFGIVHGLGVAPTLAIVQKASPNLPDVDYVEVDSTYVKVYFKSPPPSGTGNVKLFYLAVKL